MGIENVNDELVNARSIKLNISDIDSDEEETKTGLETNRKPESNHFQNLMTTHRNLPLRLRPLHVSTNLSVVVTRDEVVIEYRDKEENTSKEKSQSLPYCKLSANKDSLTTANSNSIIENIFSPLNRSTLSRPPNKIVTAETTSRKTSSALASKRSIARKGIMKRQRNSSITYHHPQRPLPPPNYPPPGYDVKSLWRKDYNMNHNAILRSEPTKRVSFDEASLAKQLQLSQQRRRTRIKGYEFFDMLSTAMPIIFAISILLASSFVPLPQSKSLSSSPQPKASTSPVPVVVRLPKLPVIIDFASRMWDERKLHEIPNNPDDDITIRIGKDNINIQPVSTTTREVWTFFADQKETKTDFDITAEHDYNIWENRKLVSDGTSISNDDSHLENDSIVIGRKVNSTLKLHKPVLRALSTFMKLLARIFFPLKILLRNHNFP